MKWYVYVTIDGRRELLWFHGYRTKTEAKRVAEMAEKIRKIEKVEITKE